MMRNRRDFTLMIADQILFTAQLLQPLGMAVQLDWTLRSMYDQQKLFKEGRSKCDGFVKVSAHQKGKAADLLVIGPASPELSSLELLDPRKACPKEWATIRQHWIDLGGAPMLSWDQAHFEAE